MSPLLALALASSFSAPVVRATDLAGKAVTVPVPQRVTCLLFVGTECPIANRAAPEINRIIGDFKDVSFFIVYVDGGSKADATKHWADFEFKAPGILDEKFEVAKFARATVTPETSVFDKSGTLVYYGRINDAYSEHNLPRDKPSKNELRDALAAVVKGKKVAQSFVAPLGCSIPFK